VAAWRAHIAALEARCARLNARQFAALRFTGPGTDLTVGLPEGHVWTSAASESERGVPFVANLPTEEIFTLPHRLRVDGVVTNTLPLAREGQVAERFTLTFAAGRVVRVTAARGEAMLRGLIDADEGAGRLGEVALVPAGSPIARAGHLFFNTLFDENAASHLALGHAYRKSLQRGHLLDEAGFEAAGGNDSQIHVDFMVGSARVDVDGVRADGAVEPLMRAGEWAA
jgi:aminopeptidase